MSNKNQKNQSHIHNQENISQKNISSNQEKPNPNKIVKINLPYDTYVVLKELAEKDDRSLSKYIVRLLKVFIEKRGVITNARSKN